MAKFPQYLEARHYAFFRAKNPDIHSRSECQKPLKLDVDLSEIKCCRLWQRKLSNKWNARILAQKLNVPVPALYWHGTAEEIDQIPFERFPENYVIKPTSAWSCIGVFVMKAGINQFDGKKYTPTDLRQELKKIAKKYPKTTFMVEEMVKSEAGDYGIPIDFKCHVFGGKLESILAIRRRDGHSGWASFYDRNWKPKGGAQTTDPTLHIAPYKSEIIPAPKCLEVLVEYAEKIGKFYGSFVRIDFYATPTGPVLGEFTPFPNAGHNYNSYADTWLETWKAIDPALFNEKVGDGQAMLLGVRSIGLSQAMLPKSTEIKQSSDLNKLGISRRKILFSGVHRQVKKSR